MQKKIRRSMLTDCVSVVMLYRSNVTRNSHPYRASFLMRARVIRIVPHIVDDLALEVKYLLTVTILRSSRRVRRFHLCLGLSRPVFVNQLPSWTHHVAFLEVRTRICMCVC